MLAFRLLVKFSLPRNGRIILLLCRLIAGPIFQRARKQTVYTGRVIRICTASFNQSANFISEICSKPLSSTARRSIGNAAIRSSAPDRDMCRTMRNVCTLYRRGLRRAIQHEPGWQATGRRSLLRDGLRLLIQNETVGQVY